MARKNGGDVKARPRIGEGGGRVGGGGQRGGGSGRGGVEPRVKGEHAAHLALLCIAGAAPANVPARGPVGLRAGQDNGGQRFRVKPPVGAAATHFVGLALEGEGAAFCGKASGVAVRNSGRAVANVAAHLAAGVLTAGGVAGAAKASSDAAVHAGFGGSRYEHGEKEDDHPQRLLQKQLFEVIKKKKKNIMIMWLASCRLRV